MSAYTDMREVRAWLEPHWAGRRVLNTFAYTVHFLLLRRWVAHVP